MGFKALWEPLEASLLEALVSELVPHGAAPLGVPEGLADLVDRRDQLGLELVRPRRVVQAPGRAELGRRILQLACVERDRILLLITLCILATSINASILSSAAPGTWHSMPLAVR